MGCCNLFSLYIIYYIKCQNNLGCHNWIWDFTYNYGRTLDYTSQRNWFNYGITPDVIRRNNYGYKFWKCRFAVIKLTRRIIYGISGLSVRYRSYDLYRSTTDNLFFIFFGFKLKKKFIWTFLNRIYLKKILFKIFI